MQSINQIEGRGLGAILLSNPVNPTGQLLEGEALHEWVNVAREEGCILLMVCGGKLVVVVMVVVVVVVVVLHKHVILKVWPLPSHHMLC